MNLVLLLVLTILPSSFIQVLKSFMTASMSSPLVQMVTAGKGRLDTDLAGSFKVVTTRLSCQLP